MNIRKLSLADAPRLQRLLERCSDVYELHEGCATPADAGVHELTAVPSPWTPDDLSVFATEDDGGELHAVAQLIRNCPEPGVWWFGLLAVASDLRGRGIGAELVRHVLATIAADGATSVRLVVSANNPRGQKFWEAAGFRFEQKTVSVTARGGHVEPGLLFSRTIRTRTPV